MHNKTDKNLVVYVDNKRAKLCLTRPKRFSLVYLPKGTEFQYNEKDDILNVKNSMNLYLEGKKDGILVYSLGKRYRLNLQQDIEIPPEHIQNTILSHIPGTIKLSDLVKMLNSANQTLSDKGKTGIESLVAQTTIDHIKKIIEKLSPESQKLFYDKSSGVHPHQEITGPMASKLVRGGRKVVKHMRRETGIEGLAMDPLHDPRVQIKEALPELLAHLMEKHPGKLALALAYASLVDPEDPKARSKVDNEMASDRLLLDQIRGKTAEELKKMPIATKDDYTRKSKRPEVLQITWPRMLKVMKRLKDNHKLDLWKTFLEPKYGGPTFHIYKVTPGSKNKMKVLSEGRVKEIEHSTPPQFSPVSDEDIERIINYSRNLSDTPEGAIKGRNIQQALAKALNIESADREAVGGANEEEDDDDDFGVKRFGSGSHAGVSPTDTILPFKLESPEKPTKTNSLLSLQRYIENTRDTSNLSNAQYILVDPTDRLKTRAVVVDADGEFIPVTDRKDISLASLHKKARDIDTLLGTHNKKQIKEYVKDSIYQAIADPNITPEDRHILAVTLLQAYSGIRPGRNERTNTKKKQKKFGALTLLGPHITIAPDRKSVTFKFGGKANVMQHITLTDPRAVELFGELKQEEQEVVRKHNQEAEAFAKLTPSQQQALLEKDKNTPREKIEATDVFPGLSSRSSTYLKDRIQKLIQPIMEEKHRIKLPDEIYKKVITEPYAYRRAHFNDLLQNIAAEAGRRLAHYHMQNNIKEISPEEFSRLRRKVFNLVSVFSGNRGETLDESYVIPGSFTNPFHAAYHETRTSPVVPKPIKPITEHNIVDEDLAQDVSGGTKPTDSEDKPLSDDELDKLSSQDTKGGIYL